MPGSNEQELASAFRFEVQIDGLEAAGFSTCSGLALSTRVVEYHEGGLNDRVHKFPAQTEAPNLVLGRGLADRGLFDWYRAVVAGQLERRSGVIVVRDMSGANVVARWEFRDAFPCRWIGPELDASANAVAVEMLELCHGGVREA